MKEEILKLRAEGKSYRQISEILGCSRGTISYHCGEGQKEKSRLRVDRSRKGLSEPKIVIEKHCKFCSKPLVNRKNIYCDSQCASKQKEQESLDKFYLGFIIENRTLRGILSTLRGNKCQECGQGCEWNNKILVLQVDHIDGNSDNNMPDNVRLLCPNCHTQTETFTRRGEKKYTKRNSYLRKYKGY